MSEEVYQARVRKQQCSVGHQKVLLRQCSPTQSLSTSTRNVFTFGIRRCSVAPWFHRTISSKCLDQTRKFLRPDPPDEQEKMAAPFGAAFLGESGRLEERNPQVRNTPRLLSPRVTRHCSAFDWPLFDSGSWKLSKSPLESLQAPQVLRTTRRYFLSIRFVLRTFPEIES
jgi:hypothetical protein